MPETPAASLLFQAPTFQEPTFTQPVFSSSEESRDEREGRERPAKRRSSRSRTDREVLDLPAEENALPEDAAPKKRTTRRKATEVEANTEEETPQRRRRARKSANTDAAAPEAEDASSVEEKPAEKVVEDGGDTSEEETGSRRRRRRRVRSTENDDPVDEVQALKGSTRLEAKKQRRKEGRKEGRRHHRITESEFLARRESVNRRMVIRGQDGLDQIAIVEDDLLVEHYVARRTQKTMVGNIYLGRVQNVLPSMEAAFVDIGRGRNAVLYAGEVNWDAVGLEGKPRRIESALKSGDPVLVQVTKDPIGHKGARLTSQITLAGRYLVLIPGGSMMGISRKLPDRERTRLKKILKQVVPEGAGVIVRTAAEGASEQQIRDDVERLTQQWAEIDVQKDKVKQAPVLLRGEPELAVRVVRDIFNEDFAELVIQGSDTYETVKKYVDELSPELSDRVTKWVGTDDLFHANRIDEQLAKGMDRKVWLPSGGTLIIDRTEAMTVIDVNTGKFIGAGGTLEETVTRNNLEAAEEIVRQLRLRDIGGIVIIDFVDMVLESNRDLVLRRLVECLGRDRTRHQVTEITSLGLVQMTRKRVGEGLVEAFSTSCEACEGRGFIVHQHPVETPGSAEAEVQPKGRKKKAAAQEPRRIEEGPERDRAREALTAIAAATVHAEDGESVSESGSEQVPAVDAPKAASVPDTSEETSDTAEGEKRRPRRGRRATSRTRDEEPAAPIGDEAPSASASSDPSAGEGTAEQKGADTQSTEGSEGSSRTSSRPKRGRRVASAPQTPVVIDLPEPVAAPSPSEESTAPEVRTVDIELPQRAPGEKAARPRRARRVASTQTLTPEVPLSAASVLLGAPGEVSARPSSDDAPAEESARPVRTRGRKKVKDVSPAAETAPSKSKDEGVGAESVEKKPARRTSRRRRVAEEEASRPPVALDLPERVSVPAEESSAPRDVAVEMPSVEDRPVAAKRPRRRRVATSEPVTPPTQS